MAEERSGRDQGKRGDAQRSSESAGRARPTIRDVAAEAGVSVKTVSRVLNREPRVQAETELRVRAAVQRLGFQRHEAAANLRRLDRSTRVIGLVIEDVANPFYSVLVRAVERVARRRGYLLLVASSDEDPGREREVLTAFCARRVDGLIVVPTESDHSYLAAELAAGTAVVLIDRPDSEGLFDSVVTANAEGAREGVEHLLAHGHRRIAFIGDGERIYTATERLRGYDEALRRAGLEHDPSIVRLGSHDVETAEAVARELLALPVPPSAFFAGNNRITMGVIRAIHGSPRPIAVVGFDDFELADMLAPPVTVVAQDASSIGRTAAERMFDRLDGDSGQPRLLTLPTRLLVRGSGEIWA